MAGRRTVVGVPTHNGTVLSWQVEQAMAETALCTMAGAAVPLRFAKVKPLKGAPPWQALQVAGPKGTWFAGRVLVAGVPESVWFRLWQLAQLKEATAVCTIAGGAVPLALVKLKPPGVVKLLFEWQLSQAAVPKLMWFAAGCFGTMLAKLRPAAWHWAQLLVMFTWSMTATL